MQPPARASMGTATKSAGQASAALTQSTKWTKTPGSTSTGNGSAEGAEPSGAMGSHSGGSGGGVVLSAALSTPSHFVTALMIVLPCAPISLTALGQPVKG